MRDLGMTTIREGWNWKNIEVGKHQYVSWMDYFDQKATEFSRMGVKVQAMVTDTPDWASSDPVYAAKTGWDAASLGKYTVPKGLYAPMWADGTDVFKPGAKPNPDNYYAEYLFDMVSRFKGKIQYWQVWNEPDYPSGDLGPGKTSSSGGTRFWTGSVQDYVRLLKISHTIVKGLDPAAKITLGGLGYESYLAAILDNGGAPFFDLVDFHAYGSDKTTSDGVLDSEWGFLGRYRAMKRVLAEKGIKEKRFACSETGLSDDKPTEQANFVAKLFSTALAQGDIELVQWAVFTNPGFDDIGLVDQATLSQKTPGYYAYQFATRQLTGAAFESALSESGVRGYRFRRADGKVLYVVWASGPKVRISLPIGSEVLDVLGKRKDGAFQDGNLELNRDPLYVLASRGASETFNEDLLSK
ncbi:MAG TPA: hypothetical protein DD435_02760 [Cyanobacteria bacterium UBA8530]|nr:hypothetical protein [Cyanobacteria bacterium UBA8530]